MHTPTHIKVYKFRESIKKKVLDRQLQETGKRTTKKGVYRSFRNI